MDESEFQSGGTPTTQGVSEDEANGFVYAMDDLQQVVEANHRQRQRETAWGEQDVREERERTMRRVALREPSPTIIALGQRLEQIRSAELERYRSKLGTLEAAQRRAVEALTRGILNKMLHGPVHELKAHAGAPEQDVRLQLVRRIFGLA